MKSVAIITARGGSKRIPGKNIKEFCGKPIIEYSIKAALDSGAFDEVMVSTDDERIAAVAKAAGAVVPFMRSDEASDDHASTDEVIAEVLNTYEKSGRHFDRFCCIYPTAPFITAARLKEAMDRLDDHESVMPVTIFSYPPQRGFIIENERLVRKFPEFATARSQDLEKLYHDCGQFYACRTSAFFRDDTTDVDDMVPVILDDSEVQDIDTMEDWKIAQEKYLRLHPEARSMELGEAVDQCTSVRNDMIVPMNTAALPTGQSAPTKLKTPFYHIREKKLDDEINLLESSLNKDWNNNIRSYSVKTNSLPWLLNHLKNAGFYAEVVSANEYDIASKIGFTADHMIYNGPIKEREVFEEVLRAGGLVNIDSHDEENWLVEMNQKSNGQIFKVGIRVNYDVSKLVPDEVLADEEGSRFGYSYENGELARVIELLKSLENVKITGLHLHSSTKSRSTNAFAALARVAVIVADEYDLDLEYVDMGGGYYGGVPGKPTYADYVPAIVEVLAQKFDPKRTALVMEPGVSLISSAFELVTSVIDTKQIRDYRYLVTDGARVYLNPQVTRRWYPHRIEWTGDMITDDQSIRGGCKSEAGNLSDHTLQRQTMPAQMVCGSTCMEYDRLFEITDEKELKKGDRIVYTNAGGYTVCLTPLFINYFPAVYVEHADGSTTVAREPWTNQEYVQKCYI